MTALTKECGPIAIWLWRLLAALILVAIGIYLVAVTGYAWAGPGCDMEELRQLRYLVQLYGRQRTDAEFALARAETARQALEEQRQRLEMEVGGLHRLLEESARTGKPGG